MRRDGPEANADTATTTNPAATTGDDESESTGGSSSTDTTSSPELGSLGDVCFADDECLTGRCWFIPIPFPGGFCSECRDESDCEYGCTTPNVILNSPDPGWSVCNEGELGAGCMSSAACQTGSICARILDNSLLYPIDTCSECESDADCGGDLLCSPTYDTVALGGYRSCVEPVSVPLGEGCDVLGSGAQACGSGLCAATTSEGFTDVGLCSECLDDDDCEGTLVCADAKFSVFDGLLPSTCG